MKSKLHLNVSNKELSGSVTTPRKDGGFDIPYTGDIFSNMNGANEAEVMMQ